MDLVLLQIKKGSSFDVVPPSQPPPPYFVFPPPQAPPQSQSTASNGFNVNRISPSVLLIIIILAVIFFVSGLLHLLVRFLLRPPNRDSDRAGDDVTVLQGQLQQLFHLHDAGVDQSFIDTLPVFAYKSVIGAKKDPFDCAVCLCEFEADDKLRLLPKCSHAFHVDCIDTWLLSHSTCPLCRFSLLSDFSPGGNNYCSSPIVLVLESGGESSRSELVPENNTAVARASSHFSRRRDDYSVPAVESQKPCEIQQENCCNNNDGDEESTKKGRERVVSVKLGKFKTVDNGEGSTSGGGGACSNNAADARRCFSMGSFAYVMDETSSLQVPIRTPIKRQNTKSKPCLLPLTPTHKPAMSECSFDSSRRYAVNGFEAFKVVEIFPGEDDNSFSGKKSVTKSESLSFSKIWSRGKRESWVHSSSPSRRAFSFRLPTVATRDESKIRNSRRTISEIGISRWGNGGIGFFDDEIVMRRCGDSLDSGENNSDDGNAAAVASAPSFARRTLLWLTRKQQNISRVVHSSSSDNV